MPRVWLFPVAFVAFLAITALPARGQSQDPRQASQAPIFRGGTQTVALYATVTDESGRLVPDLQQKDFDIYDNGKLQTMTVFKSDVQPVTVLLTLDTSGSMTMNLDLLKDAAEAFVIRLLPFDRARITNFDDKIVTSPAFTPDRDELIRYIHEDVGYGNGTRLWDAVDDSMTKLASVQGRRVVLLFTDGDDEGSRLSTFDAVTRRAESEDFMIYSIGLESHVLGITTHPDKGIRRLADATGGGYFELKEADDLDSTFTRVAEELHRQYVLGFTPEVLDGKLHRVDVRVRQPGMSVRARKSYLASKPD
ncbi:MAG TPA: VWA domain-containing protein [Vicinamibacterales bacterium]